MREERDRGSDSDSDSDSESEKECEPNYLSKLAKSLYSVEASLSRESTARGTKDRHLQMYLGAKTGPLRSFLSLKIYKFFMVLTVSMTTF